MEELNDHLIEKDNKFRFLKDVIKHIEIRKGEDTIGI